jgi:predicted GNAT superfamily acetyltransferase
MKETYTIAQWTEEPYNGYNKRHISVEYRVKVINYQGSAVDVIHERRNEDGLTAEWEKVGVIEIRENGVREFTEELLTDE